MALCREDRRCFFSTFCLPCHCLNLLASHSLCPFTGGTWCFMSAGFYAVDQRGQSGPPAIYGQDSDTCCFLCIRASLNCPGLCCPAACHSSWHMCLICTDACIPGIAFGKCHVGQQPMLHAAQKHSRLFAEESASRLPPFPPNPSLFRPPHPGAVEMDA